MSKQNGNKGRRFDWAFKEEAVRLLQTSGRRQRQMAGDIGISVSALGRWVIELREQDLLSGPHEDAAKKIARLRRERDLARQERDLLKKCWPSSPGKVDEVPVHRRGEGRVGDADISYIWTAQDWLYLAVMLDLYSRRVIGWGGLCRAMVRAKMANGARMTSDLPLRALNRAIGLRQTGAVVIHHSDRGSQYCSDGYQARLGELGFLASMSSKGNCYDCDYVAAI